MESGNAKFHTLRARARMGKGKSTRTRAHCVGASNCTLTTRHELGTREPTHGAKPCAEAIS